MIDQRFGERVFFRLFVCFVPKRRIRLPGMIKNSELEGKRFGRDVDLLDDGSVPNIIDEHHWGGGFERNEWCPTTKSAAAEMGGDEFPVGWISDTAMVRVC